MTISKFESLLRNENYAENTIAAYAYALKEFRKRYHEVTRPNVLLYKAYLIGTYKPSTANLRIQGINKYLDLSGKGHFKLKSLKVQEPAFLNNVISNEDYAFFKNRLREDGRLKCYFAVWFMAATGARISELVQLKAEHIWVGYFDVLSKGGKCRRLYIPWPLQKEMLEWAGKRSGYLFLNRSGGRISIRGISLLIKRYAIEYGLNPNTVHPHAFRHLYAKNFLDRHNDLALLADLLGHESIATTRIYLRKSTLEQRNLINQIVDW